MSGKTKSALGTHPAQPAVRNEWNNLVEARTGWCHFLQASEWGEIKSSTPWKHKKEWIGSDNTTPVILYSRRTPGLGRLYYVPKLAQLPVERAEEFTVAIKKAAARGVAVRLEIDQVYDEALHEELQTNGWHRSDHIQYDKTVQVDLTPDTDAIFQSFKKRARWEISAAGRRGVEVEQVPCTRENMNQMFSLLQVTSQRANFRTRGKKFSEYYWKKLCDTGLGYFYVARHEGDVLAMSFIIRVGKRAHYKDSGSVRHKSNLFASRYMQWQIMQDMKALGCDTYDLGGVFGSEDLKDSNSGIFLFKSGFADVVTLQGGYILPKRKLRNKVWLKLEPQLIRVYLKMFQELWY